MIGEHVSGIGITGNHGGVTDHLVERFPGYSEPIKSRKIKLMYYDIQQQDLSDYLIVSEEKDVEEPGGQRTLFTYREF